MQKNSEVQKDNRNQKVQKVDLLTVGDPFSSSGIAHIYDLCLKDWVKISSSKFHTSKLRTSMLTVIQLKKIELSARQGKKNFELYI